MARAEGQPKPTTYARFRGAISFIGMVEGLGLTVLGATIPVDAFLNNESVINILPGSIIIATIGAIALGAGIALEELPKQKLGEHYNQLKLGLK